MDMSQAENDSPVVKIHDASDPRIKEFQGLRDKELRRLRELPDGDMAGVFIAEGDLVIERALAAGYKLRSVLVDGKRNQPLPDSLKTVKVFAASDEVLEEIAGYHSYRGALGCFYRKKTESCEELLADKSLKTFVVVEGINNPTNMGVIIRCAAGLSVDAILLSPDSIDPLSRRCCRVSMGTGFAIPYAWMDEVGQGLEQAKHASIEVSALTPSVDAADISTFRCSRDQRVAVMLGAEGPGLTQLALQAASQQIRIPMSSDTDSLNVGNAAAIALYCLRQARDA